MRNRIEKNEEFNLKESQLELLKGKFPQCFLKDGSFDIKRFEEEISGTVDVVKDGYSLNWLGKSYAKIIANLSTETMITPDLVHNEREENKESENVYIQGDNLDALKHLESAYSGKIKMIYIDPPYNTGSDEFAYQDNYSFTKEQLSELSSIDIEEADRILEFTSRNSNSHSAWLTFMYPRLFIARELLSENGTIFISIDDNEISQLKLLCDEVFGEENRLGTIVWKKKTNGNNMGHIPPVHDYIVAYGKKASDKSILGFPWTEEELEKKYRNTDGDSRGPWDTMDLSANHVGPYFSIKNPDTGEVYLPPQGRYWVFNETEVKKRIKDGRIIFGRTGTASPTQKVFLKDRAGMRRKAESWWDKHGMNEDGTKELAQLIGTKVFDHPKPTTLIKHLCNITTVDDDLILDFFSGTGTTADAVMQLNADEGIGKRRFIMVQISEKTTENSIAYKSNYKDINQIGIDRIEKASNKIKEETKAEIDYGFKLFKIEPISENKIDKMNKFSGELISTDEILSDVGLEAILTTWMLYDGHQLTTKSEILDLGIYKAYKVEKTLYLLNKSFSIERNFKRIIELLENDEDFIITKVVVLGYSFDTQTLLSLEENVKHLINGRKSADVHLEVRY